MLAAASLVVAVAVVAVLVFRLRDEGEPPEVLLVTPDGERVTTVEEAVRAVEAELGIRARIATALPFDGLHLVLVGVHDTADGPLLLMSYGTSTPASASDDPGSPRVLVYQRDWDIRTPPGTESSEPVPGVTIVWNSTNDRGQYTVYAQAEVLLVDVDPMPSDEARDRLVASLFTGDNGPPIAGRPRESRFGPPPTVTPRP